MRALQALGIDPGTELLAPIEDQNPRGFFEDVPLLDVSERVLQALDLTWDSPQLIAPDAWRAPAIAALELEAVESIRRRFDEIPDWGFKNPRTARLMPFWSQVFERCGRQPVYLVVVRNPLSVAQSLHIRNGISAVRAHLLWLMHMTEAVIHTRGARRLCLDYDRLIADPGAELARVSAGLGLSMPPRESPQLKAFVDDFLTADLRNSRFDEPDVELDPSVTDLARTAHGALVRWSRDDPKLSASQLQRTFGQIERSLVKLAPVFTDLATTDRTRRRVEAELATRDEALVQLRAAHDAQSRDLIATRDELTRRNLEIDSARARVERLEDDAQNRVRELGESLELSSRLSARLESRDHEFSRTQERLEAERGKLEALTQTLAETRNENARVLASARDEIAQADARARAQAESASELRVIVESQRAEIADLRSAQARVEEAHRRELQRVEREHASARMGLEERIAGLSNRFAEIEADRAHGERGALELRRELVARDADVESLRQRRHLETEAVSAWLKDQAAVVSADLVEKIDAMSQTRQWALTRTFQRGVSRVRRRSWVDGLAQLKRLAEVLRAESTSEAPDPRYLAALTSDLRRTFRDFSGGEIIKLSRGLATLSHALRISSRPDGPFEFVRNRIGELHFFYQNLSTAPGITDRSPRAEQALDTSAIVDVVIPVFRAREATLRCIRSVLDARNRTPCEIIVIDDASRDSRLSRELEAWAAQGKLTLLRNDQNLGFPATANRGMTLHSDRDVVLLNSDTLVHGDWLDRLRRSAHGDWKIATATPFSNNAEICSYPALCRADPMPSIAELAELDSRAARVNRSLAATIPTAVGFCMYVRRDALREVGPFDVDRFGRGYGEENDFCLRARALGYRHVLAADVFVAHEGAVSFSDEKSALIEDGLEEIERANPGYRLEIQSFLAKDPARWLRQRLDADRLTQGDRMGMLLITHAKGGGTHRHVVELADGLEKEGITVFLLQPSSPGVCRLYRHDADSMENLEFRLPEEFGTLVELLRSVRVRHIHIQHLLGIDSSVVGLAAALGCEYDATLHDYLAICPRVHVTDDRNRYCGIPAESTCNACVKRNGSEAGFEVDVGLWRRDQHAWLAGARRVFVPSEDARSRLSRQFPDIGFTVRVHAEDYSDGRCHAVSRPRRGPRHVAVIGAIGPHKGSALLHACALDAAERDLPLEFHLIGFSDRDRELLDTGKVVISGRYEEGQLGELLRRARSDIAFIPSVWPETFCYTLSEAFRWQIYPVALDLGAIAERVRALDWGDLLPPDADPVMVNDHLLAAEPRTFPRHSSLDSVGVRYSSYLDDYYDGVCFEIPGIARHSS